MARIRTIKPSFFTSLTIAELSFTARLTFIGLLTHVDDDGRCVADARLIRAAIWPLDDRPLSDVEDDLRALTERSLMTHYEVEGRRYYWVNTFTEHQRINRKTESVLPGPEGGSIVPLTSRDEDSLRTHGVLSEVVHREGKGREGKGRDKNAQPDSDSADLPADKNAANGGQTVAVIEEDQTPRLTGGLLVAAWCDGWTKANDGKKPPPASVKRIAGACKQIATATPVTNIDAWRDAWQAAHDAGKKERLDVVGQLTDNGKNNRRPERSAAAFLDVTAELPDFRAIGA